MSPALRQVEQNDRRVLAAVRFVDPVTGRGVEQGLTVRPVGDGRWFPNRSGLWVLRAEGVLDDHAHAFEAPPGGTVAGSVAVTAEVFDATGAFAPRRFAVAVPREGDDLLTPVDVLLVPAPSMPLRASWAAVRVSVAWETDGGHPVPIGVEGALVRLEAAELGGLRCAALTDARGEALVVAHGIPRLLPGTDADTVVRGTVEHELHVVVERSATDFDTGRRDALADPDDLWARRGVLATEDPAPFDLSVGGLHAVTVPIPRP
ncbi:MAG: hypothetical protein R3F59_05165 [Myxococcota bacterium]